MAGPSHLSLRGATATRQSSALALAIARSDSDTQSSALALVIARSDSDTASSALALVIAKEPQRHGNRAPSHLSLRGATATRQSSALALVIARSDSDTAIQCPRTCHCEERQRRGNPGPVRSWIAKSLWLAATTEATDQSGGTAEESLARRGGGFFGRFAGLGSGFGLFASGPGR